MKVPCKNCERRQIGFHGKCDEYKAFKEEHNAAVNALRTNEDVAAMERERTKKILKIERSSKR